ncbi:proto-oncogene Mas-like [Neopelma chrysocephalum]|uniref:proto-oncogene Mas-like n=1 Tax=Neopelma chrysocephalum TaxID=114329 RepID=UPI000FCD4479|nr:proto-oncogene Mas-like [Neopelma chrysocephalum]
MELNQTSPPPTSPVTDTEEDNQCWIDVTDMAIDGVTLLIGLCGLVGNGAVLWLLGFHIRRNPSTVYILNLAVADFTFLLFVVTSSLLYMVDNASCSGVVSLRYLRSFFLLSLFSHNMGLFLLTAISVERCVGVLWPFWCRCHRPRLLSPVVCSLLWALACVLAGLVYFVCDLGHSKHCWVVLGMLCFLSFCVLTPLMVVSNVIIFIKLRRSSWQHHSLRLYAVIFLTVFFFLLFGVPLSIQIFLNFFVYINLVFEICLLLASVNSSINPIIYVLVGSYGKPRLRGSVKVALQRVFEDRADSQEVGETPVVGTAA